MKGGTIGNKLVCVDITWHGKQICCIQNATVQRIDSTQVLVNGAIIDFPDAVSVTHVYENEVKDSEPKGEKKNV